MDVKYIHVKIISLLCRCSKSRVHPAPCVHILAAGCMYFETCAPGVQAFPTFVIGLYSEKHMNRWPGASFLGYLHPAGAHNKNLILNNMRW